MKKTIRLFALFALAVVGTLALAACSSATDPGGPSAGPPGSTPDNPVSIKIPNPLPLDRTFYNWDDIEYVLSNYYDAADKYVALDLSDCIPYFSGSFSLPSGGISSSETKVVSLILPDVVTDVGGSFRNFTALRSISGKGLAATDGFDADGIFKGLSALTTVDFPELTVIYNNAFSGCTALTTVNLPKVTIIYKNAFKGCTALTTVDFLELSTIGESAFTGSGLTALTEENFPKLSSIGVGAFSGCAALVTVDLPKLVELFKNMLYDSGAFAGCAALTTVNLPEVEELPGNVFSNCPALATVNLPMVTDIGAVVFSSPGGQPLTVTLGTSAPTLETDIFLYVDSAKTVTVKVPSGATGYASSLPATYNGGDTKNEWGNGFRGAGWIAGSIQYSNAINHNISLTIMTDDQ
jgi:hypothetical protein